MPRVPVILAVLPLLSTGLRAEEVYSYADHAKPIFANACNNCHNPDKKKGGLDLSSYAGVMAGGSGGDVVSPGDADGSKLLRCVMRQEEPFMPPKGDRLNDTQIDTLRKWIAGGLRETKTGSARSASAKKKAAAFTAGTIGKPDVLPALFPHLPLAPPRVPLRPAAVLALATNPWSPILAVGAPGQVVFYDTDTLSPRGILPFEGQPRVLSFSSSGAILLAAGGESGRQGRVSAWTIATAQPLLGFEAEMDEILAADLRPDLGEIALGGSARKVRFVNSLGEKQDENKKHTEWITASVYSPDGVLLATADRNGGVRVWEAATRNELHELRGHDKFVTGLAWRPDSNVLATVSEDGTARLWEMAGGTSTKKWDAHGAGVTDVAFASDGSLATVGRNNKLKLWDGEGKLRREYLNLPAMPLRVRFAANAKRVFVGDIEGRILVFEPDNKSETHIAQLGARLPSLEERISEAERRIGELKPTAAGAPSPARKTAESSLEGVRQAVAAAEKALEEAKAALPAAEKRLAEIRKTIAELEKHLPTARETRSKALAERDEAAKKNDPRLAELNTRLAQAETAEKEAEKTLSKDLASLEAAKQDIPKAKAAVAPAELAVAEAKKKLPGAEKALQDALAAEKNAPAELAAAEKDLARWKSEKLKSLWWNELNRLHGLVAEQPEGASPADSPEVAAQKARVAEAEKAWKASAPPG